MATKGAIITDFGSYDKGQYVFVQPDNKIVVMGVTAGAGNDDLAIARYNSNGSLDNTFDKDGKLIATAVMTINAVYPFSDGKFLAVGTSGGDFAVARYNNDGSLDSSFGKEGKAITNIYSDDTAYNVTVQIDNKLLVVGGGNSNYFIAARYNSDGSLDTGFSGDGILSAGEGGNGIATCTAIQPDGKIVMAGNNGGDFVVTRLDRYGNWDTSFNRYGNVTTDVGGMDSVYAVNILNISTGKILVIGSSDGDFAAVRYNIDGSLDTSFGVDGIVTTDLGGTETLKSSVVLADGKFLAAGTNGNNDFVLARYNADGSLDTSFDKDGIVTTDLGGWEEGNSLALQKDGKILVVGTTDTDIALVRYNTDGSLDTSFNGTGNGTTPDPTDNSNTNPDTTTQTDTGTASVKITPTDLQTNEQGDSAKLSVVLTSAPTRDVKITFTSSDTTEGKLDKTELTFTGANWATPQIITVTGQNDSQVDGNIAYTITGEISTIDVRYKSVKVGSITLTNQDTPVVGAETINGMDGTDILHGTDAPTYMLGKAGDDDCSGGAGNDTIYGQYGADVLFGEDDNDYLYGEQDADYLDGGRGNDSLNGGLGADTLIGGVGNDTYYLVDDATDIIQDSGLPSDVDTVIMRYQVKKYTLPIGIENGAIADGTGGSLTGNSSNNSLTGNAGNNSLNGGAGSDTLSGGDGKDSFIFNSVLKANLDKITDFSPKFDRIQLDDAVFKSLHTGALSASAFNNGGALDSSDRIIYNKTTGAVFYDDDGSGAHAAVQIAIIGGVVALTAASFSVI